MLNKFGNIMTAGFVGTILLVVVGTFLPPVVNAADASRTAKSGSSKSNSTSGWLDVKEWEVSVTWSGKDSYSPSIGCFESIEAKGRLRQSLADGIVKGSRGIWEGNNFTGHMPTGSLALNVMYINKDVPWHVKVWGTKAVYHSASVLALDLSKNRYELVLNTVYGFFDCEATQPELCSAPRMADMNSGGEQLLPGRSLITECYGSLPGSVGNITGKATVYNDALNNTKPTKVTINYEIRPKGQEKGKAEMTLADKNALPDPKKPFTINIKWKGNAEEVRATLSDISRLPGTCMNSESRGVDDDLVITGQPDWKITQGKESYTATRQVDGLKSTKLTINATDYGAWGKLKCDVLINGVWTEATGPDGKTELTIPVDDNGNKIADAWERKERVMGMAAYDDSEDSPEGDGHKGDGLTLFEEYRGFMENGKHIFGNPRKKDIFIVSTIKEGRIQDGAALLAGVTGLVVHSRLIPAKEADGDGVVNFNYSDQVPHLGNKWAIVVALTDKPSDEWSSHAKGSPGAKKTVFVAKKLDPSPSGWWTNRGGRIKTDVYATYFAHEALHTLGVRHHGDSDPEWKYWTEEWDEEKFAVIKEYDVDLKQNPVGTGKIIYVLRENGKKINLYAPKKELILPSKFYVATQGGEHSGMEDCLMRYSGASAYIKPDDDSVRILVDEDLPGIQLCTNKKGTGVNDKKRKPWPRYGDATKGDCAHQFCANDAIKH